MQLRHQFKLLWLTAALTILSVSQASATCWVCLYDSGSGQYYCQSVAGWAYANCTPIMDEECQTSAPAYCEHDQCQCQRFPALPDQSASKARSRTSIGALLFRGLDQATVNQLATSITTSPSRLDMPSDVLTPGLAVSLIGEWAAVDPAQLQLAGYAAATARGPAHRRLLGSQDEGILIDSRPGPGGQHARLSQLIHGTYVESSNEINLGPRSVSLSRVRVGGEDMICLVWAETDRSSDAAEPVTHRQFIEAADAFPTKALAEITADSPRLQTFNLGTSLSMPSPWMASASYHR